MKKFVALIFAFVMFSTLNTWAQDNATQLKVDQFEQRVEELEQKQEKDDEAFGKLSDIAKYVSIGGVLSGVYQYEWVNGPPDIDDQGRGALSFQPEISIAPSDNDEIFFLFGFGAGNGLAGVTPFTLAPWAAGVKMTSKISTAATATTCCRPGTNILSPSVTIIRSVWLAGSSMPPIIWTTMPMPTTSAPSS